MRKTPAAERGLARRCHRYRRVGIDEPARNAKHRIIDRGADLEAAFDLMRSRSCLAWRVSTSANSTVVVTP